MAGVALLIAEGIANIQPHSSRLGMVSPTENEADAITENGTQFG